MLLERRRFLLSAGAAGLLAGAPLPALARSGDTLDGILAEVMKAPQRLRSGSLLFREMDPALPDLSVEASERAVADVRGWIARLTPLRDGPLDGDARDTLETVLWDLNAGLESQRFYWLESPLSADGSAIAVATDRLALTPLRSSAALDGYLGMLEAFPAYVGQIIEKVRGQQTRDIILHRETVAAVARQLDALLASPAATFVPAPARLTDIAPAEAARFTARAKSITDAKITPALRRLAAFLNDDYLPRAGTEVGLWRYPDGADYYRFLLRFNVTRELDPEAAHGGALETVAEADKDLAAIRREVGFTGSAEAFHEQIQRDPRWKSATTQDVAARFEAGMARFEPHYARFFAHRPSTPYGVAAQPPEFNDVMVNGRYQWPTADAPRGTYFFNGGDLDATSWIWATPLIFHELVPGHHQQLDRVYASKTLPPFRKSLVLGGSTEGWAEYSRKLAVEAGLYADDPMGRYADRLMDRRMAMMAAADTGMHVKRWSLDKAVDYFSTNAITKPALQRRAMLGIATEYPGFLLSYWAGGAEFARLRRSSQAMAGASFDIRQFHEVVLSAGVIPFPVLEARLRRHFAKA